MKCPRFTRGLICASGMALCAASARAQQLDSTGEPSAAALEARAPQATDTAAAGTREDAGSAADIRTLSEGEEEAETNLVSDTAGGRTDAAAESSLADTAASAPTDTGISKAQGPAAEQPDTSLRFYDSPFVAFGTGWTLGSMVLFDEWQAGLPDSIGKMPGYYTTYADSYAIATTEKDAPDAYNTAFPFSLSFAPAVREEGYVSIGAGFWWMSKDFFALWQTASQGALWEVKREMSLLSVSAGASYNYRIPAHYFAIANIDRAFLTVGLSGSPYVRIKDVRHERSDVSGAKTSVEKRYRGYGVSWEGGISTLRPLSERAAIEIGVMYLGHWIGRFMKDDHHVRWSAINDNTDRTDEVLGFLAHRFKIYFNILAGRRPKGALKPDTQQETSKEDTRPRDRPEQSGEGAQEAPSEPQDTDPHPLGPQE